MIDGVALVNVYGSAKYAVRIDLDPGAMTSRGLGIDQVQAAVGNGNVDLPTGVLYGDDRTYNVIVNGQYDSAKPFADLIVSYQNGAPVRLRDIGRIYDGVQTDKLAAWVNGTRGLLLAIQKQPGVNTIAVVQRIRAVPGFEKQLPAGVDLKVFYDRTESIRASVDDVEFSLMLALILVVLVIFIFLRNLSATIIPSLALPMSIVGTVRDHVSVRLQSGQSLADGAHALRRLRGGRRHRHAGKHFPAHGNGQDANAGDPGWFG